MNGCGFEPDRTRAWLSTPIGAKIADGNPALQRSAEVLLEAMNAAGSDPLMRVNLLVKVLAMVIAGMARDNTAEDIEALCEHLGPTVHIEAADFLRLIRRDMRAGRRG